GRVGTRIPAGRSGVADLGALTEGLAEEVRAAVGPLAAIRVLGAGLLAAPIADAGEVRILAVRVGGTGRIDRRPDELQAGRTKDASVARVALLRPRPA